MALLIVALLVICVTCAVETRIRTDAAGLPELVITAGEKVIAGPEPLFSTSCGGVSNARKLADGKWAMSLAAGSSLAWEAESLPDGRYGETRFRITVANTGADAVDVDVRPPFSAWAHDPAQTEARSTEHMFIGQGTGAVVGGIGAMRCHQLGGAFNGSSFVAVPASDGEHYVSAYARTVAGGRMIAPNQKAVYEVHLFAARGSRNDALRETYRVRGGYVVDPGAYDFTEYSRLPWVRDIVAIWCNWAWDRDVMEPRTGEYNLTRSLDEARRLIGGYDVYVFWPFWPRAGFDERLQYDHFRDLPGGLAGLEAQIAEAHELGTRVVLGYCYWSEGDRFGWDNPDVQATSFTDLVDLACVVNADGAIMDCMSSTPKALLDRAEAKGHKLLPYNEGDPSWQESQANLLGRIHDGGPMLAFNLMKYMAPHHPILRVTWPGTHGRSMRNDMILSFFNGHGVEINTMWPHRHPRSRQEWPILARMLDILRTNRCGFQSTQWEPLVETGDARVWANRWPAANKTLYTLCGTDANGYRGDVLRLPHRDDVHYLDLWRCRPIEPRVDGDVDVVPYELEPYAPGVGIPIGTGDYSPGCIAVLPRVLAVTRNLETLRVELTAYPEGATVEIWLDAVRPDSEPCRPAVGPTIEVDLYKAFGYSNEAIIVRLLGPDSQLIDLAILPEDSVRFFRMDAPQRSTPVDPGNPPAGMVRIAGRPYGYSITQSQPVWQPTYPNSGNFYEPLPESPEVQTEVRTFWMDRFPVTNAEYHRFIQATGYLASASAAERQGFLAHWAGGRPPEGKEDHPVVYVSYDDAVAYARWAGKRLPTEEEWQFAGGAGDGRVYPWGSDLDAAKYNSSGTGTAPVTAHPTGASPFGVEDLVGNVWQWTASLMTNGQHELVFVRGGSWFDWASRHKHAWWIRSGPRRVNDHHPLPLFGPGMNRFSTVGFRCAKDEP